MLNRRDTYSKLSNEDKKRARWDFYGGLCWLCKKTAEELDHVKPRSHQGSNLPANLRPICTRCNRLKSGKWPFNPKNFDPNNLVPIKPKIMLLNTGKDLLNRIDKFRHSQEFANRNEAMRWLVDYALKQNPKRSRS